MIIHHVDPGSDDWWSLRAGIPTSSNFDRILTPTGKLSTQRYRYMYGLAASSIMGFPTEKGAADSRWMQRGSDLEDEAARWFELEKHVTADKGGFCTTDDGMAGCSPDRLVYPIGWNDADRPVEGLEIKCASPEVHLSYVFGGEGIVKDYRCQVQGSLWVTGLETWTTLAYHSMLPPGMHTVERDEEFIALLEEAIAEFIYELKQVKQKLRDMGYSGAEHAD